MKFNIKDVDGNTINTILATAEYVADNFDYYEEVDSIEPEEITPTEEEVCLDWRDSELVSTDRAAMVPDWPNRSNIIKYRKALRDWPATQLFPTTKPVLSTSTGILSTLLGS